MRKKRYILLYYVNIEWEKEMRQGMNSSGEFLSSNYNCRIKFVVCWLDRQRRPAGAGGRLIAAGATRLWASCCCRKRTTPEASGTVTVLHSRRPDDRDRQRQQLPGLPTSLSGGEEAGGVSAPMPEAAAFRIAVISVAARFFLRATLYASSLIC